jgi:hypothetical protein
MTDIATAQQLALEALSTLDAHLLLILADLLEELGDTRAWVVRQHAFCCPRGFNIANALFHDGIWKYPYRIDALPALLACAIWASTRAIGGHFNVRSLEDIPLTSASYG